jgi:hypothetical protein
MVPVLVHPPLAVAPLWGLRKNNAADILLLALIIGAAYIQTVRNHCHLRDMPKWAECVTRPSW